MLIILIKVIEFKDCSFYSWDETMISSFFVKWSSFKVDKYGNY